MIASIVKFFAKINWVHLRKKEWLLTPQDHLQILKHLKTSNYIILIKRRGYLSDPMICFANWYFTGKWGYWTHVLMNIEGDVGTPILVEATGKGVHKSVFNEVFNCDSVCIMRPRISYATWEDINNIAYSYFGREYDTLGDILDDKKLNCVEYVMDCLLKLPNGPIYFHGLTAFLKMFKNLTPDMYKYCGSFEVVYEARHD